MHMAFLCGHVAALYKPLLILPMPPALLCAQVS